MSTVTIDPALPLHVTIDFQSKHRAAFRLFTQAPGSDDWEFLKEGIEDAATLVEPMRRGSRIGYEFIYFAEEADFRAMLVFRQDDRVLDGGAVPVKEKGDAMFVEGEVLLA